LLAAITERRFVEHPQSTKIWSVSFLLQTSLMNRTAVTLDRPGEGSGVGIEPAWKVGGSSSDLTVASIPCMVGSVWECLVDISFPGACTQCEK
jgi:hypothetical protein